MINFTRKEILEILKAWAAISVAFTIMFTVGNFKGLTILIFTFIIALFTAGLGFLLHELGHKVVAEHYGCRTQFIADNKMLIFAIAMSFFGFIFAAPGAVYILGHVDKRRNGIISIAGPLMNLILACAFFPGIFLFSGLLGEVAFYGFSINAWLGLFNMIPLGNFDGSKVFKWSKAAYFSFTAIMLIASIYAFLG